MAGKPILYSYYRSSCSWRVRIALALKGIEHEYSAVNLLKSEQLGETYLSVNPTGQVPALQIDSMVLTQSNAIIEYLDETRDAPSLLPKDPKKRFLVRELSQVISCGIQPVQNLKVLRYIGDEKKGEWGHRAIKEGFEALEKLLEQTAGTYCVDDEITMADLCLVPQVYNANRFKVDMSKFPVISRINAALMELDSFKASHPSKQPDCPEDQRQ
ncbi:maleylacetoacetate isomerase-like [Asterias rubens]|uniref:maleylacetoacetate isomerase-like n=1 Tax=Asterias rubens TaxID=7604 RepID=UPI001455942B|nr:maleylacetoacetate isomerase-like [Asterias rubens]